MKKNLFLFAMLCLFVVSCKNNDEVDTPEMYKYVNEWLYDNMSAVYYWNTTLPYYKSSADKPSVYFKSLIYKDDRFSAIFESYEQIKNELNGITASEAGFEFQLYRESDANENVIAIVLYTKMGTPAQLLGIKRGDIIRKMNGKQLTMTNYSDVINYLFDSSTSVNLTFSDFNNSVFTDKTPVVLNKVNGYKDNPVYLDTVYTIQNKKIGYLVYHFFTNDPGDNTMKYDLELNTAIGQFKQQNITDLVVDLRYNHGGMMTSAINLASMLVPNLTTNKVFSYTDYNRNYADYFNSSSFKNQYPNENPFSDNFATTIDITSPNTDKIPVQNIGNSLQRI
ncbi:MAG: S41 family peptidase, partial [Paludibacter sp.]